MPPRIALDFAVVNALGRGLWRETVGEPGAASNGYAAKKRWYRNTAQQCKDAGIRFQPMVFEAQGGMTKETAAVLHVLSHAVSQAENADPCKCKNDLFQRVAWALVRLGRGLCSRVYSTSVRGVPGGKGDDSDNRCVIIVVQV